jgi:hypothetical protein
MHGMVLAFILPIERDGPMAGKASDSVHRGRVTHARFHIVQRSGHKEGGVWVRRLCAREIQIALSMMQKSPASKASMATHLSLLFGRMARIAPRESSQVCFFAVASKALDGAVNGLAGCKAHELVCPRSWASPSD